MPLEEYRHKRDFRRTPEPKGEPARAHRRPLFVVQEHHASHLHYDFRLEAEGVLKSWAVPKEPSLDPAQKRLAVRVEDHPLAYASFAGTIPEGQYGAGEVLIWDRGTYDNLLADKPTPQTVAEGIDTGRLEFDLHGEKLRGRFVLIRMKGQQRGGKENWLLIKMKDEFAQRGSATDDGSTAKPARRQTPARPAARASKSEVPEGTIRLTHGDKVLFPETGITKAEVFAYYRSIAPRLLPFLRDRPITLERLPEGIGGASKPHFWQKHTPAYYPDWIPRVELPTEQGKPVPYLLVNDRRTLLYLVNQGVLTFHPWLSRVQDLDRPDFVLFDLDPGSAAFADVITVAQALHDVLKSAGERSFVKTSGKSGLHVLVPWELAGGYDEARTWARDIAAQVVEALPERGTLDIRKAQRGRRVYLDVLQNARGHHAVPPYVLRPVPGAPISTPLDWRELKPDLDPGSFTLRTFRSRLHRQKRDPWSALAARFQASPVRPR